ncbi:MAG: hypothetical protein JWQ29_3017 [Phenylobacterium sp.]|nr:hypothetical protein [Phenylobacterium sp.]
MLWICGGCRAAGACRLGITHERFLRPGVVEAALACPADHQAGPGVAHGGWTAAVMDDLLGHLAIGEGRRAVTATLTVDFLRPVPVERPLVATVWCESNVEGRRLHKAELKLASTGALLARGSGVFVERDDSHFERHRAWLARQDARAQSDPGPEPAGGEPG